MKARPRGEYIPPPPATGPAVPRDGRESPPQPRKEVTLADVCRLAVGGPRRRRRLLKKLPRLSPECFRVAAHLAGLLWSPSLFYVGFSAFLEPSEEGKPGGAERSQILARQLRCMVSGGEAGLLDAAWRQQLASLGRHDLLSCWTPERYPTPTCWSAN